MAAKLEKTRTPGIYRRGSRFVVLDGDIGEPLELQALDSPETQTAQVEAHGGEADQEGHSGLQELSR